MSRPTVPGPVVAATRIAVSALLLLALTRFLDLDDVLARLSDLRAGWVALGLAITVLQVGVLAWRWSFTAARLGIDLPFGEAVVEYYLSILLNQLLPGGVPGDVARAWRHARSHVSVGPALRAVILERASGQIVMTSVALASVLALPWSPPLVRIAIGVVALVSAGALLRRAHRGPSPSSWIGRFKADAEQALLAPGALTAQVVSASLVVVSYVAVYVAAARAVGVQTPLTRLLPLVAPVLMTMLLPVTVAGWGIRESAAAALWGAMGLTPEDGVAISVAYGLLVLLSSAPGVVALIGLLGGGRGRRGYPPPS